MINFETILKPSCAAVRVAAANKDEALEATVRLLASGGKVSDPAKLLEDIRAREKLSSTGIGEGVAVPHALCEAIPETVLAVLRLAEPVDFGAIDGSPVDLIFMMAGPRGETTLHLKLLSKLARLLHDEEFRKAARAAPDGDALARLLFERD
ncbi:MAG: hypothetical protein A2Z99_05785 [Treponema sp. GWB1_62_6]|nr:MAG: hypothetical protein A2Z99_05785 [Treponema sp. GWB1_62_6]OHE67369.1 MAG: hypothetical protein A2001_07100 [Treponema sp. GWC1_61_84]OHE76015.1 MAG: hypothetical protein A2413_17660 [Treponema sp. RIFOXYC1_FULL_61_9]HCM27460.1 hypothetical protein [Treponema sp.]